jgi:hypothetical protein
VECETATHYGRNWTATEIGYSLSAELIPGLLTTQLYVSVLIASRWVQYGDSVWINEKDSVQASVMVGSQQRYLETEENHGNLYPGQPVSVLCHRAESRNTEFGSRTGSAVARPTDWRQTWQHESNKTTTNRPVNNFPTFMEPERSVPRSQLSAVPVLSHMHPAHMPPLYFLFIRFNIILTSMPRSCV